MPAELTDQKENEHGAGPRVPEPTHPTSASPVIPPSNFRLLDKPQFRNTTDLKAGIYEFYVNQEVRRALVIGEVTGDTKAGASSDVTVVYIDDDQRATLPYLGIALYKCVYGTTQLGVLLHDYAQTYGLILGKSRIKTEKSGQKFVTACFPSLPFTNPFVYPSELRGFAEEMGVLPKV